MTLMLILLFHLIVNFSTNTLMIIIKFAFNNVLINSFKDKVLEFINQD